MRSSMPVKMPDSKKLNIIYKNRVTERNEERAAIFQQQDEKETIELPNFISCKQVVNQIQKNERLKMHIYAVKNLDKLIVSRKIDIDMDKLEDYLDKAKPVKGDQGSIDARLAGFDDKISMRGSLANI